MLAIMILILETIKQAIVKPPAYAWSQYKEIRWNNFSLLRCCVSYWAWNIRTGLSSSTGFDDGEQMDIWIESNNQSLPWTCLSWLGTLQPNKAACHLTPLSLVTHTTSHTYFLLSNFIKTPVRELNREISNHGCRARRQSTAGHLTLNWTQGGMMETF